METANLFLIGDVHGCYNTFEKVISSWNPENEILIQVGDLIDRGNFSRSVIQFCKKLEANHPGRTIFIMGNHEWMLLDYFYGNDNYNWLKKHGRKILWDYELNEIDHTKDLEWIKKLNISWENEYVIVSHAGITNSTSAMDPSDEKGLLWNKQPLKKLNKVQVHGHKPLSSRAPVYNTETNSWNIDTGGCYGNGISALRLKHTGELIQTLFFETLKNDIV